MKKVNKSFNYIGCFILIAISAVLTAFVYVQLVKDLNNPENKYKESFINISIPKINSIYRPMVRNARLSINRTVNTMTTKIDNFLRKNKIIS
jgi:hypothetical protein